MPNHVPIILDIGSHSIRAGFAGTDEPKFLEPSAVGSDLLRPGHRVFPIKPSARKKEIDVKPILTRSGESWHVDSDALNVSVESILYERDMHCNRYDHPVLFSFHEISKNQKRHSKGFTASMIETLFEYCEAPAIFGSPSPVLAAFASGRTTALVSDFGAGSSSFSWVQDGHVRMHREFSFGGDFLDSAILRRLEMENPGWHFPPLFFREKLEVVSEVTDSYYKTSVAHACQEIKHSVCRVALAPLAPPPERMRTAKKAAAGLGVAFKLPDNTDVDISSICEYVPELIFNPKVSDKLFLNEMPGNFSGVASTIQAMVQLGAPLKSVVVGGSSQFPGFLNRFSSEVSRALNVSNTEIACIAPAQLQRPFASWTGGSILGSMAGVNNYWIYSKEYQEQGIDRTLAMIGA